MYHRIAPETYDPWALAVEPSRFKEQLEWLTRNRTPLSLSAFADLHGKGALPRDAVAITFDDAYACTAKVAAPTAERLGVPITIFLPDLLDQEGEFWWDELERIVLQHDGPVLRVDDRQVSLGKKSTRDRSWPPGRAARTARQSAFHQLWSLLRTKRPEQLRSAIEDLRVQTGAAGRPRESHRPMTIEEARSFRTPAVEFGSHTLTHSSLPRLSTAEKRREIGESVSRCTAITGQVPVSLAYPYGDNDAECQQLAEEFGFTCACTTEHRGVAPGEPRFALPRVHVRNFSAGQLATMLGQA